MHQSTLRRNFAASCATPDHTSICATCGGTSQGTRGRWTGRTSEPSRARSATRWPKHFAEFFLEAESNFERVDLESSTSVLRQLLLSFLHTAAQNADSPQHRTAGWRFIHWNEVEQRELLTEAKNVFWRRDNCFHEAQPRSLRCRGRSHRQ